MLERSTKPEKKKLNRLALDLPKISSRARSSRRSDKENLNRHQQNSHNQNHHQTQSLEPLSPKVKGLRKLFFQYKSNARILEKSPYYGNKKSQKNLVSMISSHRYDISEEMLKQIENRYQWSENDEQRQSASLKGEYKADKRRIKAVLHYDMSKHEFTFHVRTCEELLKKVTFELAKIMQSTKNSCKKCDSLIGFETTNNNHEVDFILSNPKMSIENLPLDSLSIKPCFNTKNNRLTKTHMKFVSSCPIPEHPKNTDKTMTTDKTYQLTTYKAPPPLIPKIQISDFKFLKCLGSGGFSTVYLTKGNFNGKYYAMKLIDKKFIIESQRQGIVENQRFILGELKSHFVTELQFAFESKNYFVLVVEYCPGGELFYQLKKVKRMTESQARFYFLEILIGLNYIHKKNIIYRDLKPENLLIGIDGHLKIADFGLSKPIETAANGRQESHHQTNNKTLSYSFCGSPEYMAPQMLTKSGHNYLLDYYCLGALIYELVIGVPPYYSLNHDEIYNSILNQNLTFPSHIPISDDLESLLRGLLEKNPKKRLGSMFGVKEVLLHPWIGRIKEASIENLELEPPFLPDLKSFNFDLSDLKADQEHIAKKIEEDIRVEKGGFETCFNEEFYYEKESFSIKRQQQFNLQNKALRQAASCSELKKERLASQGKLKHMKMSDYLCSKKLSHPKMSEKFSGHRQFTTRNLKKVNSTSGLIFTQRK